MSSDRGAYDEPLGAPISIEGWERCYMKAVIRREALQFYYSRDGKEWLLIGGEMDATKLSDEHAELVKDGVALDQGFTGAFIGICAQDLSGQRRHADFDYFTYRELDE
ncbi:Beta-xylosidase [compost metagenome]